MIRKEYVVYGQSSKKKLKEQLDKLQAASASVKQAAADTKGMCSEDQLILCVYTYYFSPSNVNICKLTPLSLLLTRSS